MSSLDLARQAAEQIVASLHAAGLLTGGVAEGEMITATQYALHAMEQAVELALGNPRETLTETRTVTVEAGHISLDVNLNAKGELQYGAKVVMPMVPIPAADLAAARLQAQSELEQAEEFLRSKYGRTT